MCSDDASHQNPIIIQLKAMIGNIWTYLQMMTASKAFATVWKLADKPFLSGMGQLMITYITGADRPILTSGPIACKGFLFHMNQLVFSLRNQNTVKSNENSKYLKMSTK